MYGTSVYDGSLQVLVLSCMLFEKLKLKFVFGLFEDLHPHQRCVCVHVYMHIHMECLWRSEEGIRSARSGVAGRWEAPDVRAENQTP